jgi:hypothetical protein
LSPNGAASRMSSGSLSEFNVEPPEVSEFATIFVAREQLLRQTAASSPAIVSPDRCPQPEIFNPSPSQVLESLSVP